MNGLAFALALAVLNRFAGGGLGWSKLAHDHGGPLRGRPIYYAALALFPIALAFGFSPLAAGLTVLSYLAYRLPGWYGAIDGGTNDQTALRDYAVMMARTLLAFPIFAAAAWRAHDPFYLVALLIAAIGCAGAYHLGARTPGWLRRYFPAEWAAGFLLGLAFALAAQRLP